MIAGQCYTRQFEQEMGLYRELKDNFVTVNMTAKAGIEIRIVGSQVGIVAGVNGSGGQGAKVLVNNKVGMKHR